MIRGRGGIESWAAALLAAVLIVGLCGSCRAEELPASTATPASAFSSGESGSPDAPPPRGGQAPKIEAPSIGAASGFESATPEVFPSPGGESSRQAPEEEAPALGGPSGGEQLPEEATAGRYAPWWTRVPNVQPFPPLGNTIVPPRDSGYYTFEELLRGDRHERPPRNAYPRFVGMAFSFYNADYRYLDTGEGEPDYFDFLKRIPLGDNFLFTTGGEWRWRYDNEVNSRLSGKDNVYYLTRTRVYADFWYRDLLRLYGEVINAQSFDQDLPPQTIDQS
ncbi:MAG: hypothetical protein ACRELF_14735, partial [Gemmataceae bacterium]